MAQLWPRSLLENLSGFGNETKCGIEFRLPKHNVLKIRSKSGEQSVLIQREADVILIKKNPFFNLRINID